MTERNESQIAARARLDAELTERAFAELAASVCDPDARFASTVDDIEQTDGAAKACLKYWGIEPGEVPDSIRDAGERLDWLCRPSGTMRRAVRLDQGWQKRAFGALLGKLDTGQAVALLPRGMNGYCYLEPGTGKKVKVTDEVAAHIDPNAILFYKPLPAKPLTFRDTVPFVSNVFDKSDDFLVLFASIVVALIGLAPAWANKIAFGTVVPSGQVDLILPVAALLLGVAVSTVLINACRNLVMARISTKLEVVAQAAIFARVLALPTSFFKQYSSGNLAGRVENMNVLTRQITSIALGAGLTALFSLIYIIQIGAYAPSLAVPALIVVLVQFVLTVVATNVTVRFEKASSEASVGVSGVVTALLNGIQKIKVAGAEDRAFARWARGYAASARANYKRPTFVIALPALVAFIGLLGMIAIYYLAGSTEVSVANYMAFNAAYGQVTGAVMAFAAMAGEIACIQPMLELAKPILEATPEASAHKPSVESVTGEIEVSGVAFRYSETSPFVFKDLSFKVAPGEYIALVGRSGCGKSTVMRLLLGFETPERGSIMYGHHDISKVDVGSLRRHIGVVMQDGKLFMGDIASNITISNPQATLDDAWEAAEIAGIADDIRKMPMGMQTFLTEGGGSVSGGQRQRLMIARAVCGKRRILLLDEATSALDNKTQKHVADALGALNCTRIVAAHRLSTVKQCDRILVLDSGVVAEEGTYEELIAKNGIFAELVERQRLDTGAVI